MKSTNSVKISFIIGLFFFLFAFQTSEQNDVGDLLLNGTEDLDAEKYRSALYYLDKALRLAPEHQDALYYSGMCYVKLSMPKRGVTAFKKIRPQELSEGINFNYWFAQGYFLVEKFDNAQQYLDKYLGQEEQPLTQEADNLRIYINNAKIFYQHSLSFTVENLGKNINSEYSEFSPSLNQNQTSLIFTTNRKSFEQSEADIANNKGYDILISKVNHDGVCQKAKALFPKEVRNSQNTSLQILVDDVATNAKRILLTREGELMLSELRNGKWLTNKLGKDILNEKIKGTDAFLSQDGKILFFSSTFKTINKNLELYVIYLQEDGTWTRPKAIESLNSEQNDCSPFLAPDGKTFYFSSQGHDSMGGYDIFKADFDPKTKTFSTIKNLQRPLNSAGDEKSFSLKGEVGYFSSNRTGGVGETDIYRVFFFNKMILTGEVRDLQNNEIQANTLLRVIDSKGKTTQIKTDLEGKYALALPANETFTVQLIKEEKLRYVQNLKLNALQVINKNNRVYHQNFYFNIKVEDAETLTNVKAITQLNETKKGTIFKLRFVYFKTGSAELKESSFLELQNLANFLRENSQIEIEIGGHTDNVGEKVVNQQLSQRRAESVRKFLINEERIAESRLKSKGYGDTKPLVSNDDEKEGREINRRIEVKILK
jgi:outer membrane protein OmpA-like peptidoglycan-associated protein